MSLSELFSPVLIGLYTAVACIIWVIILMIQQWSWSNTCRDNICVRVVYPDGSTDTEYAKKQGGYVSLKASKDSNAVRLWPINALSTIEEDYPGAGYPSFLQKKIRVAIVNVSDWEPMLNRGSYTEMVASPDVVKELRATAEDLRETNPDEAARLDEFVNQLSTAPTREMVANPEVLGNLLEQKVTEVLVNIGQALMDKLTGILNKLASIPNGTAVYAMLGVIIVAVIYVAVVITPLAKLRNVDFAGLAADLQQIKIAMGLR